MAINPYGFNNLRLDGIYSSHRSLGDLPINYLRFKGNGVVYSSVSVNDTGSSNKKYCCIGQYKLIDNNIKLSFEMEFNIPLQMEGVLVDNEIHLHVFSEYINKFGETVKLSQNKKFKFYCTWR